MSKDMNDDKCENCGDELLVGWTSFDLLNEQCEHGSRWEEYCEGCGSVFQRQFDKTNSLVLTLLSIRGQAKQ